MSEELFYCPFCGSQQDKTAEFCGSCGAGLKSGSSAAGQPAAKVVQETPYAQPPPGQQAYTHGTQATYTPAPVAKKDNATIGLILGIVGFFFSCFIIPIIGLVFVKKAVENNEDSQTITIARVLNWITLALTILALIGGIVYLVIFLSNPYWWYI